MDLGSTTATRLMEELFALTLATVVRLDLAEPGRMAGFTLGLPHALNLAFLAALTESRVTVLPRPSFDIQRLNEYGAPALETLNNAIKRLRAAASRGEEGEFATLM